MELAQVFGMYVGSVFIASNTTSITSSGVDAYPTQWICKLIVTITIQFAVAKPAPTDAMRI